jgi:peptidoglycan/LPS O-acetylase OafA/YrhL
MKLIFEQDAAVVFFYVLSGFVLGRSLSRDSRVFPFVIRRLARLLPVLWASLAVAIAVSMIVAGPPIQGATNWYNVYRSIDTSPHAIVMNVVALSWRINSVMWSVQIELFVIPLLPLGVLAMQRLASWQLLVLLIGLCVVAAVLLDHVDARPVAYLYCFYIGIMLPY